MQVTNPIDRAVCGSDGRNLIEERAWKAFHDCFGNIACPYEFAGASKWLENDIESFHLLDMLCPED